jgi:hypothetical protein
MVPLFVSIVAIFVISRIGGVLEITQINLLSGDAGRDAGGFGAVAALNPAGRSGLACDNARRTPAASKSVP